MSIRPLQQILTGEPALAEFVKRRLREASLEQHVRQALPRMLSLHVRVSEAVTPEIVLVASSGAAAGLIRQRSPQILRALDGEGWKFTAIRVRVQARPTSALSPKISKKQLDSITAKRLLALASSLSNDGLAKALRRLAAHSRHGDKAFEGVKDQDGGQ